MDWSTVTAAGQHRPRRSSIMQRRKPGAGRKPIPTNLKVLRGTDQPCRINPNEPKPKADRIRPPFKLSKEARRHWTKLIKQLRDAKIVTEIDAHAAALYCESFATYCDAIEKVRLAGSVVKGKDGFPVRSPYLVVAERAHQQMRDLLTEFGMTPSSRTRVTATEQPKKPTRFKKLA